MDVLTDFDLPRDHPGFEDTPYRSRRAAIAEISASWQQGAPPPAIRYEEAEDRLWAAAVKALAVRHERFASHAFRAGAARLDLPTDRVPQLAHVDRRLQELSGFSVGAVPGLVPTREFYGSLADRVFLSTQYLRHPSVPFYTPEPDVIHEAVGHLNMLADPLFAELHRLAGEASRRCCNPTALEFFSRVFWFTLEFGVIHEAGEVRAYGAGLASSIGELEVFREAEIRAFDIPTMGTFEYDITRYQPVLFAVESMDQLAAELGGFFSTFDDLEHERLTGLAQVC